jgi:hypothetical protein
MNRTKLRSILNWEICQLFHGETNFDGIRFVQVGVLKWQLTDTADRHIGPLGHIILIPSQPVFDLTP